MKPSEPPISFRGALQLLGEYEPPLVEKIDALLGGMLLIGGGAAALASTGSPAAPLAAAALWGWVDQKSEGIKLVRRLIAKLQGRLADCAGLERIHLLQAAHSMIVIDSLFQAVAESMGDAYKWIAPDDIEKLFISTGERREDVDASTVRFLLDERIPVPSASGGLAEVSQRLQRWYADAARRLGSFVSVIVTSKQRDWRWDPDSVVLPAVARYQSQYLHLARSVPEFMIWALVQEDTATRNLLQVVNDRLQEILEDQSRSLGRLESLLSHPRSDAAEEDLGRILHRANLAIIEEPVVDAAGALAATRVLPSADSLYVNPRFRCDLQRDFSEISSEQWWAGRPVRQDLDILLASHFTSASSQSAPMLVLGHPGAGKSLLSKIVAARLPVETYVVVRVPLRQVSASAPVYRQIEEAIENLTHGRADWANVARQSGDRLRVVILDGLDELIQASTSDRSSYLREVADFQRLEYAQGRPVAAVVTSRTLVAERIDTPIDTLVIKLEDFSSGQVTNWVEVWNERMALVGTKNALSGAAILKYEDLSRQPLLLLMLAIFDREFGLPAANEEFSEARLYEHLITGFARRECQKTGLPSDSLAEAVEEQVERLSIAALGIFNRGRQSTSEQELQADLRAVLGEDALVPGDAGRRLLAEFFFVHAAEATEAGVPASRVARTYEFLHATFWEYLVARFVHRTLLDIRAVRGATKRAVTERLSDELLFAVLSSESIAVTFPMIDFFGMIVDESEDREREDLAGLLMQLIRGFRRRSDSTRYAAYLPVARDDVARLAVYSSNLYILLLAISPEGVAAEAVVGNSEDPDLTHDQWRNLVHLWRSGLKAASWLALLSVASIEPDEGRTGDPRLRRVVLNKDESVSTSPEWSYAQLLLDQDYRELIRFGLAVRVGLPSLDLRSGSSEIANWLLSLMARVVFNSSTGGVPPWLFEEIWLQKLAVRLARPDAEFVHSLYVSSLAGIADLIDGQVMRDFVRLLLHLEVSAGVNSHRRSAWPWAIIVAHHPRLLADFSVLLEPTRYVGSDFVGGLLLSSLRRHGSGDFLELGAAPTLADLLTSLASAVASYSRDTP